MLVEFLDEAFGLISVGLLAINFAINLVIIEAALNLNIESGNALTNLKQINVY